MDDPPQADVSASSEKLNGDIDHVHLEKKIGDPTIACLLRSARRIVEEKVWESGMVWYPGEMLRRASPSKVAERVLPDIRTPAGRACVQAICSYTGKPFSDEEARDWLAERVGERLDKYVIRARSKISEIRLVVTERSIEIRAERPDTTLSTVGPLPFSNCHVQTDFPEHDRLPHLERQSDGCRGHPAPV